MKSKNGKGALYLEDGSLWEGRCFGAESTQLGEVVFHTAHQGYQEILTDPSYRKQHLVFSSPQMGNQGFHADDFESSRIWASSCLVRDYSDSPEHWRAQKTLDEVLKEQNIPGLFGMDTRGLILHLREKGSLWAVASTETADRKELKEILDRSKERMLGLSLVHEVSTKKRYVWTESSKHLMKSPVRNRYISSLRRVVVMDFGVKAQILRYLIDSGFQEVVVVPAKTTADEIMAETPDAVFLSNGPGDPAGDFSVVEEVRKLIGRVPLFGICLGHQILGLALGLKTFKLKFGHHGANHPVLNLKTGKVEITSQNHGFAVAVPQDHLDLEATHINLNDQTLEGFRHRRYPIVAIQFHPESAPGPLDSLSIFEEFQRGFAA